MVPEMIYNLNLSTTAFANKSIFVQGWVSDSVTQQTPLFEHALRWVTVRS